MMKTDVDSSLPTDRAFVVQFVAETDGRFRFRGRVEHVDSGHATRFESATELLGFMQETLCSGKREAARAERLERLVDLAETHRTRRPTSKTKAVVRFLSSRLGVRDRLGAKTLKSA